jgi:hypothetical protein
MSELRTGDLKNNVADLIKKYIEFSGDPRKAITSQAVRNMLMAYNTTVQQRAAMGAHDYTGALKYQRLQQYLQQVQRYYVPNHH